MSNIIILIIVLVVVLIFSNFWRKHEKFSGDFGASACVNMETDILSSITDIANEMDNYFARHSFNALYYLNKFESIIRVLINKETFYHNLGCVEDEEYNSDLSSFTNTMTSLDQQRSNILGIINCDVNEEGCTTEISSLNSQLQASWEDFKSQMGIVTNVTVPSCGRVVQESQKKLKVKPYNPEFSDFSQVF